jgi:GT2 family glycosyltransferase
MTDNNLNIWLTIPTGTRRQYLADIIKESQISPEKIVIVHTVESEPIEGVNNIWDLEPVNIQRWWNRGIDVARTFGADYIAVLNDDLRLKNNPINKIAYAMKELNAVIGYPLPYTGAIPGYCWVLDVKSNIRADENFRWWYGDDDIRIRAALQGEIAYVPVEVEHIHPNHLTSTNEELMKLTRADQTYFEEKWGTITN